MICSDCFARNPSKIYFKNHSKSISYVFDRFSFDFERFLAVGNPIIIYSLRKDFTGFTVAARRLRKVTTAIVTAKTANSARANTQTCKGT